MTRPLMENEYAERLVEIRQEEGLHMRPAMQFVDCANGYASKISVHKGDQVMDGKSIMQVTMLAATYGTQLKITAEGEDAQEAVEALAKILEDGASKETDSSGGEKAEEKQE